MQQACRRVNYRAPRAARGTTAAALQLASARVAGPASPQLESSPPRAAWAPAGPAGPDERGLALAALTSAAPASGSRSGPVAAVRLASLHSPKAPRCRLATH